MEKHQIKQFIARRVARELKDGDVVNLGIGLPTLVAGFVPAGVNIFFQSENGFIGVGPPPPAPIAPIPPPPIISAIAA